MAGRPLCGSRMCGPRSAVPEVATARSWPATTALRAPGLVGWAIPTRHGPPTHWTSPPPETLRSVAPAARSRPAASSTAQPFTQPLGSSRPPGWAVNQPSVSSATSRQRSSTSATSGSQSARVVSALASRLTWLSRQYGEKTWSIPCSRSTAARSAASTAARRAPCPASRTVKENTVPITCSACRSGAPGPAADRTTRNDLAGRALGEAVIGRPPGRGRSAARWCSPGW